MTHITTWFPVWAIALSVAAFLHPAAFASLKGAIAPLLGVVMFAMGLTLRAEDFRRVIRRPRVVGVGVALQYAVMPFSAYAIARLLDLPSDLMVGMVLVGSSAGGTASNVVCYLARGDVALSITLTLISTLLAVVAMPLLTWIYVGRMVPVPVEEMLFTVALIVALPVLAGAVLNTLFGEGLRRYLPLFPLLSMAAIVLIIAIIVALNQPRLVSVGVVLLAGVILHNAAGLASGYWLARGAGYDEATARTLAIEVGMQNSGLSVALAIHHFAPIAALPGALFSVWHNLSGALLAGLWSRRPRPPHA